MTDSAYSEMSRPVNEMIAAIHDRADSLRSARIRRRVLAGSCTVAAASGVLALLMIGPGATPKHVGSVTQRAKQVAVYRKALDQSYGQTATSNEPPAKPVGSGWSAANPSLPLSLPSQWSPLINSALKVFEHVVQNGQPATLTSVADQSASQVAIGQGQYAGTSVEVDTLPAFVADGQDQIWRMTAVSQNPFSSGGSVAFQGDCTWTVTGTSTNSSGGANTNRVGTCTTVVVDLVGAPTNPYSATVSTWTQDVSSTQMTLDGPGS